MFCVYNPERLRDMFGERATFGMPFVQALLNDDGLLDATFKMQTVIGDQRWVDVFTSAGIPAVFDSEMLLWLRCHVGFSIAMLGVCVPAKRRGEGATWKEASTAAAGMYANFALTKSMGYRLHPAPKAIANSLPSTVVTGLLWLLSRQEGIRNLLGQARPECNALIDSVIEAAQKANKVSVIAPLQAVQSL
ncbi:hypothetical protein BKA62DRAFT_709798 [Auriculariales sp. MPI-PUGE-AT-0066]|nr:hypothetical protein BKA62DRAFT_709798 [Auriculariales sp. MPI-PUGE-AT-0066]